MHKWVERGKCDRGHYWRGDRMLPSAVCGARGRESPRVRGKRPELSWPFSACGMARASRRCGCVFPGGATDAKMFVLLVPFCSRPALLAGSGKQEASCRPPSPGYAATEPSASADSFWGGLSRGGRGESGLSSGRLQGRAMQWDGRGATPLRSWPDMTAEDVARRE